MSFGITIRGWRRGLRKVELTKAIMAYGKNYGLKKAKEITDRILDDAVVSIDCGSEREARQLLERANSLNAIAEYKKPILA